MGRNGKKREEPGRTGGKNEKKREETRRKGKKRDDTESLFQPNVAYYNL